MLDSKICPEAKFNMIFWSTKYLKLLNVCILLFKKVGFAVIWFQHILYDESYRLNFKIHDNIYKDRNFNELHAEDSFLANLHFRFGQKMTIKITINNKKKMPWTLFGFVYFSLFSMVFFCFFHYHCFSWQARGPRSPRLGFWEELILSDGYVFSP